MTVRNLQMFEVGTMLQVRLTPQGDGVIAKLKLGSSRMDDLTDQTIGPRINTPQIETTRFFELDRPRIIGSMTTQSSSVIVVKIMDD
jgi:hypothetical protein